MSDLKEYLKCVLMQLRLIKHLPPKPSPQDVKDLQNVDWLIEETEERILKEEENECDGE